VSTARNETGSANSCVLDPTHFRRCGEAKDDPDASPFVIFEELFMEPLPREVVWLVSIVLIEAAIIDGRSLRVPNWLTYHFLAAGLAFAFMRGGSPILLSSLAGAAVGLLTLLPLYAIGGMGAGDVKLMAGLGAWLGPWLTVGAFVSTALAGALMALVMIVYSGAIWRHIGMAHSIVQEVLSVRNPVALSQRAAERKPAMMLLPYAIPIAAGSIAYFAGTGLLT
jgi:prepilin peptidase CpaA